MSYSLSLPAVAGMARLDPMPVRNFNFKAVAVTVSDRAQFDSLTVGTYFAAGQFAHGKAVLGEIKGLTVLRREPKERLVVFLFGQGTSFKKFTRSNRFVVLPAMEGSVMVEDPIISGRKLHLRIRDVTSGGISFACSLSNRHLFQGLSLKAAQLILPGVGIFSADLRICHAREEQGRIVYGAKIISSGPGLDKALLQYIALGCRSVDSDDSPVFELRASFALKELAKVVTVRAVSDEDSIWKVLDLRLRAYVDAAKISKNAKIADMADEFDRRSVILAAELNSTTVGTKRIVLSPDGMGAFPFESIFGPHPLTVEERRQACEVGRLAIDPRIQGTDLLVLLMKKGFEAVVRSGCRLAFAAATDSLQELYLRIGARRIGQPVAHPYLENENLNLFRFDILPSLSGNGMSAIAWEKVVKEVVVDLSEVGLIDRPKSFNWMQSRSEVEKTILKLIKSVKQGSTK